MHLHTNCNCSCPKVAATPAFPPPGLKVHRKQPLVLMTMACNCSSIGRLISFWKLLDCNCNCSQSCRIFFRGCSCSLCGKCKDSCWIAVWLCGNHFWQWSSKLVGILVLSKPAFLHDGTYIHWFWVQIMHSISKKDFYYTSKVSSCMSSSWWWCFEQVMLMSASRQLPGLGRTRKAGLNCKLKNDDS